MIYSRVEAARFPHLIKLVKSMIHSVKNIRLLLGFRSDNRW